MEGSDRFIGVGLVTAVLVTGAAGFVGSHLCEALLDQGHTVRGLDAFTTFYDPARKRANVSPLLPHPQFSLMEADLLEVDLTSALDGVDAVVHLAGEPGVTTSWGPSFSRYVDRNVLATQRLLEGAVAHHVEKVVYASSSSVYGGDADSLRARGEPRPFSPYGVSKLAGEALVGAYALCHGLSTVSLRYFSVYGPRQRPDMAAHRFIEALLDGAPLHVFGDGSQVRDFTYVGDVVRATVRALFVDLPPAAVVDVASGHPVAVSELIGLLHELTGQDGAPVLHTEERRGDVARTEGRSDVARDHLGWTAEVDLRIGLEQQIAWHAGLRRAEEVEGSALEPPLGA